MVSREQKRLSLPFNILSPKRGKASPQRKLYISKPMSAFGPKGESIGIVSDETVVPLRIHCEIFGPSVHYKSVGVKACTTVQEVISSLLQKMDRLGGEENVDLRSNEFCMAEISLLPDFSYFRILEASSPPLPLYQQHSKRYGGTDSWKLKLILKSQISSIPSLFLADYKSIQNPNLKHITVDCNCIDESYLSVSIPILPDISCEKVINKIISEFAYLRQPDDFSLHCFAHPVFQNDAIPNSTSIEQVQKRCEQDVMELYLKFKYDDFDEKLDANSDNITAINTQIMADLENGNIKTNSSDNLDSVEDSWVEFYDSVKDKIYFVNSQTEEIRWLHPTTNQEIQLDTDLPPGWIRGVDKESSRIYYKNTFDKKIEWSHPLRHLQRIYKHSLHAIGTTSLPRPSIPQIAPPPVPTSSRPILDTSLFSQHAPDISLCGKKSRSLHSSSQSFVDDIERSSSDAILTESISGKVSASNRTKLSRKNKRLNNLKRFLTNEKTTDISDNTSVGSGHKIKSILAPLTRGKKAKEPTWDHDVIVNLTPDHSPFCRKKSVVSSNSTDGSAANLSTTNTSNARYSQDTKSEDSAFPDGELAALQSSLEKEQHDTKRFSNLLSEQLSHHSSFLAAPAVDPIPADQDQTAVSALDEAFSLLDCSSHDSISGKKLSALIIENQNPQAPSTVAARPARKASEGLLNDCFAQISDSSFDGGSGEEMVESTHKSRDAIVTGEVDSQVEISTQGMGKVGGPDLEADDLIGSSPSVSELKVSAKVALFEQKLTATDIQEGDMSAVFPQRDHNGSSNLAVLPSEPDGRERTESVISTDSVSGDSVRTEDSEGMMVSRNRNKLRTKKGRMSRNTSALDHQELEQLNKGVEPQKSILKHSRSDSEDREEMRKGVTFLSSSVQMIEIERMNSSDTSHSSEFDSLSIIHKKGDSNWRNALKTFYDEVDKQESKEGQSELDGLIWSPDEGIGLVEEERFRKESTELITDRNVSEAQCKPTEDELKTSSKPPPPLPKKESLPPESKRTHPPNLPPRPTSADMANLVESTSEPATPNRETTYCEEVVEEREGIPASTDSMLEDLAVIMNDMTSMVGDAACVVRRDKVAATESNRRLQNNESGDNSAIADSGMFSLETSTNLEDSIASPYKGILSPQRLTAKLHSDAAAADEPVVVSSLVEPITPNAMVPMEVFLPKERPSLLKESPAHSEHVTPVPFTDPVVPSASVPSPHSQARASSPVLVDQLNKPLSDTAFIYGYQYHGKPTDKSQTLHSGYLALVRQTMNLSEQQAKQQAERTKQLHT